MPRAYISEIDKDRARLADNLKLIEGGRTVAEMAAVVGISPASYSRRQKNPEKLKYKEIYRLCRNAKIKVSDFCGGRLKLKGE